MGGAITHRSFPAPPGGPLRPTSPDLPSLPPVPPGPTRPGGGFGLHRGLAWELSRLSQPQWGRQSPSAPLPLLLDGPSRLPFLISPASLLCPQAGPLWPRWGFGGWGSGLGAQQAPWPERARQSPSTPLRLFLESPSHLPLLISPASGVPILSGFHFSSPLGPPTSYWFTLGFLPSPWGSESPTSSWQVP